MKYLSVCSGIEAATVAWHSMGWKPLAFSEIEKFPAAVLAHHYPNTPNLGDMTKFKEWENYAPDILVGGTPCQSFSVAGLRKGLDDPRGNLMLTYLGIADRYRPRWVVWENVPGVLSSNGGKDFGTFLGALAQLGYGFAYRVLDAQYFGVPQRRRRVFVVGYLGDWRRAAAVLFEQHSLSGHPAPSRKKGEEVAGSLASSSGGCNDQNRAGAFIHSAIGIDEECNATINGIGPLLRGGQCGTRTAVACFQKNTRDEVRYLGGDGQIAGALASSSGMKQTNYICTPVSPTLRAGGNKTGGDRPPGTDVDTADSLIVTPCHTTGAGFWEEGYGTLRGREQDSHENLICMSTGQASAEIGIGIGTTLNCNHEAPIICHGTQDPCVSDIAFAQGRNNGGENVLCAPVAFGVGESPDLAHCLRSGASKADKHESTTYVASPMQVRRLTPTECERLQGFPDGYTNIPWRNKPESPDGPRYKALGNSMAVPVMRWIGERINLVDLI